uniref:T9SS type A sorting domain-containing protein n=1 Tax=Mariniflexile sp. TaxID=1979402 RepID=UPI0040488960
MLKFAIVFNFMFFFNGAEAQVFFEESSAYSIRSIEGSATWTDNAGDFVYNNSGTISTQRAILYSTDAYQSDDGFRLTVEYTTGSIDDDEGHNFSFGLISDETDLSAFSGFNPFGADTSVYSIGVNLTTDGDATARGMNFTNGSNRITLDTSGTRTQFATGETTKIFIEISYGGFWSYYINDIYEASGVIVDGIDLSKTYRAAIYGQDDNGGGKSIQSIKLEKGPASGKRADKLRGSWHIAFKADDHYNGRVEDISIDPFIEQVKDLKTLHSIALWLSISATNSAVFSAPHKLLESFSQGDTDSEGNPLNLVVPRWGGGIEPENDPFGDWARAVITAGFNVKVYVNSENLIGTNLEPFADIDERWKAWCDTNAEAQAFINSQPYHTGIWNASTQQYEDATSTYPERKYLFCYAEYIIKDYSLRYGDLISSWIFDSAKDLDRHGDDFSSGLIEEQRIYQAIANAVRAGNPDIPVAFQNGRSTINYFASPFQIPSRFDDFTFGHAFGGNGNHADKEGSQFTNNYRHVQRMTATDGYVFEGGNDEWDDLIVGNFHSKLSTTSWSGGNTQAWEQVDFNQWNEEAIIAGGSMTWGIPHIQNSALSNNFNMLMYDWARDLLYNLDDYLVTNLFSGAPVWAGQVTTLPEFIPGKPYEHTLIEGSNFWDPENVGITNVSIVGANAPAWLTLTNSGPGVWTLSGTPTETIPTKYTFELRAEDADGGTNREVTLKIISHPADFTDPGDGSPVWKVNPMVLDNAIVSQQFEYTLEEGIDFYDFELDNLSVSISSGPGWLSIEELSDGIWYLSGTPENAHVGQNSFMLSLNDGTQSTLGEVQITVDIPKSIEAQIQATALTNYGIGQVATMISETQTAPDGLATYKISIDVTPPNDKAVISGISGGIATEKSWGLGDGTNPNSDYIFTGSDNEWVESINNIQVIDFNANGGSITTEDITAIFKSITIINAQSTNDYVSLSVGGIISNPGKSANQIEIIDLESETSSSNITDFAVGVGNTSSTNKWSIEAITVVVDFNDTLSNSDPTMDKVDAFSLFPNPANDKISLNIKPVTSQIFDITGKRVIMDSKGTNEFNISSLSKGIYIIKVRTIKGNIFFKKFLKK